MLVHRLRRTALGLVTDRIASTEHPQTGKRFLDMTYQPMLEVLAYLRASGA
jgi:hypothetical protein